MNADNALSIAQDALLWLVSDEEELHNFIASSGSCIEHLRQKTTDPDYLGSVLDHCLMSDETINSLSVATGHPPEIFLKARAALPGGDVPNWT